jgi:hypothetical protein
VLEETTYDPNDFKKKTLDDISAPVLEETTYTAPTKKHSLEDISAPVLEDTFVATPTQKHSLEGVSAPTLDTTTVEPTKATTPKDTPSKSLEQVSAPVLEAEPEEHKPYVSKYANADIERAKQEGAKKARTIEKPELTEEEKKKSREAYKMLMRQKEEEMAKKGGKMVILLVVFGLLATVGFHLFITMPTFTDESIIGVVDKIKGFLWYYDAILLVCSFLMLPKVEGFKTLASVVFGINTLATLGLGAFLLSQMESIGINIVYFLVSLVFSALIVFQLSSNENIGKYYAKSKQY